MCDGCKNPGHGWKGWQSLPPVPPMQPIGSWVDLSHSLSSDTPKVPAFPQPIFTPFFQIPKDNLNVTRMDMIVHTGTHIDSPQHFFNDAPALDAIPLDRLHGRGIVWPVHLGDADLILPQHLRGLDKLLRPGDILLLDTGWHEFVGTNRYENEHPSLSVETADWIVARRVKMLGIDFPTPDLSGVRRGRNFDFPIHRRLLQDGILIAEHLTNLRELSGRSVEVFCGALNIVNGDGAPARIVAREIAQTQE